MFNIRDHWSYLSPALKRRWWKETEYNKLEPSANLQSVIITEAWEAKKQRASATECEQSTMEKDGGVENERN